MKVQDNLFLSLWLQLVRYHSLVSVLCALLLVFSICDEWVAR
jgi:hypothetical protein